MNYKPGSSSVDTLKTMLMALQRAVRGNHRSHTAPCRAETQWSERGCG